MQVVIYITYALLLIAFLLFAGFAVHHAFRYRYISPRVKLIAWVFMIVSVVLIGISLYFLVQIRF